MMIMKDNMSVYVGGNGGGGDQYFINYCDQVCHGICMWGP